MATQHCPKCNNDSFTWRIEDVSNQTIWSCHICQYQAFEDESRETKCECCDNSKIELKDQEKMYWWCFNCNKEIK